MSDPYDDMTNRYLLNKHAEGFETNAQIDQECAQSDVDQELLDAQNTAALNYNDALTVRADNAALREEIAKLGEAFRIAADTTTMVTNRLNEVVADRDALRAQVEELTQERDALARDIALVSHTLRLAYDIREALGWNKYTSLDIMPNEVRRIRNDVTKFKDQVAELTVQRDEAQKDYNSCLTGWAECRQLLTRERQAAITARYERDEAVAGLAGLAAGGLG